MRGGVWLVGTADNEMRPVACWPEPQPEFDTWREILRVGGRHGMHAAVVPLDSGAGATAGNLLVCPLLTDGALRGLVAIEVAQHNRAALQAALQLLQWGAVWLEMLDANRGSVADKGNAVLLRMLARMVTADGHQAWIDALADELGCARVALVRCKGARWRLAVLSGKRKLDTRSQAANALANVVGEALVGPVKPRAVQHVVSLRDRCGQTIAGLLLERPARKPFTRAQRLWCEQFATYAGPLLDLIEAARPSPAEKLVGSLRGGLTQLFGPRRAGLKSAVGAGMLALVLAAIVPVEYRVSAPATLEGRIQRVVSAPRDGFVASALVRAGDTVKAGDVLAVLDSRELSLEAEKWRNQRAQWQKSYRQALADRKRAEARIQRTRVARADAELALIEAQLARNTLKAPIDGLVVSGDLSQALDAPVSRGDILFEVAPLDAYRVVLEVDDRDIAALRDGAPGELMLDGLPGREFSFTVRRIMPVSRIVGGRNRFRVEAELDHDAEGVLRPGMAGNGKVLAGRHSLLWIIGHRTLEWLRVRSWLWWF